MKLTEKSKHLMSFFLKNKLLSESKHSKKTDSILLTLYDDMLNAYAYLSTLKKNKREKYYKLNIKKILSLQNLKILILIVSQKKLDNQLTIIHPLKFHILFLSLIEISICFL
jgi:hypothetical protein